MRVARNVHEIVPLHAIAVEVARAAGATSQIDVIVRCARHTLIEHGEVRAPATLEFQSVAPAGHDLVTLIKQRNRLAGLQLIAGKRTTELPVRDVRARREALCVHGASVGIRHVRFPVVRVAFA